MPEPKRHGARRKHNHARKQALVVVQQMPLPPSHSNVPKSQMRSWQSLLTRMLLGLRSRCMTLAACTKCSPRRSWNMKNCRCCSCSTVLDRSRRDRSVGISSKTTNTSLKRSRSPGTSTSSTDMTFSWADRTRPNFSSRSTRVAMAAESSTRRIRLTATCRPVDVSVAAHTTPYAPSPTTFSTR